ncbi:hypothetical protein OH77DRAFT_283110 [Trametes cingulata]|nr:hypothetical protein OH77DRAFT_283110 [Trametes cingulata]
METYPSVRPPSVETFGEQRSSHSAGRSSPLSTASGPADSTIRSAVRELQESHAQTRGEVADLRGEVADLRQHVQKLDQKMEKMEKRVDRLDKSLNKRIDGLEDMVNKRFSDLEESINAIRRLLEPTEEQRREEARRRAPAFVLPLPPTPPQRRYAQLPPPPPPPPETQVTHLSVPASQSTPDLRHRQGRGSSIANAFASMGHTVKKVASLTFQLRKAADDLQASQAHLEELQGDLDVTNPPSEHAQPQQAVAGPSASPVASGSSRRARDKQRELLGQPIQPGPR